MTRRSLGAALAAAASAFCLLWLAAGVGGAGAGSSAGPVAPKDPEASVAAGAPEGIAVTASSAAEPMRLAANEEPEAGAPEPAAEPEVAARAPADRPGILEVDTDQPLSIKADELEAIEDPDGSRQLIFKRKVNVDQGGLQVQSDRLEAHYAPNTSQPERLVANGNVRVRQKSRELSCARATYFPATERLECVGNALLRDGANRVTGETIEILFAEDRIRVKGGAVVNVAPDKKKPEPPKSADARAREATP